MHRFDVLALDLRGERDALCSVVGAFAYLQAEIRPE